MMEIPRLVDCLLTVFEHPFVKPSLTTIETTLEALAEIFHFEVFKEEMTDTLTLCGSVFVLDIILADCQFTISATKNYEFLEQINALLTQSFKNEIRVFVSILHQISFLDKVIGGSDLDLLHSLSVLGDDLYKICLFEKQNVDQITLINNCHGYKMFN